MSKYNYTDANAGSICLYNNQGDKEYRVYDNAINVVGGEVSYNQYAGTTRWEYRTLCNPPGNIPEDVFATDTSIVSLVIKITVKARDSSLNDERYYVRIRCPNTPVDFSSAASAIWSFADTGTLIEDSWYMPLGYESREITITNTQQVYNILKNGLTLVPYNTPTPKTNGLYSYEHSVTVAYILEYTAPSVKPDVSLPEKIPFGTSGSITEPFLLKWAYTQEAGTPQTAIDLDIRAGNESFVNLLDGYPLTIPEYTLSPHEFPAPYALENEVYIRLRAYSNAGLVSEYTSTYLVLAFPQLKNLSPGNAEILMFSEKICLQWDIYAADNAGNQYEITNYPADFDIQYSTNSGESWNSLGEKVTAVREGSHYYYDVPENTFSNGIVTWRVRPYVNGYTINEYVQDTFVVRVQASTSSVTCDGKPLPTISWTSSVQIAYQVRFADYDSGARYGTDTSFTVPYFYADGYYPVQVRTQASDGTWSAWTELEYVQITNTAPANSITLNAVPTRHAVVLNWTDSGTSEAYIVYRNYIPVYVGKDTSYTDIAANGECTYYVRAIQSKDYSQSNSVTVNAYPKTDCLYDFASMRWIPLKYSLQERSRNYSSSADVVYKNYAGRTKPVAFSSGLTVRQMSGSYVFKTREEALRLRNTAGHTVIFKDTRGGTIIGILNDPVITVQRKLYAVTFLVTETDYIEEREYAAE